MFRLASKRLMVACSRSQSTFCITELPEGRGALLRGRPFLPGSQSKAFPTHLNYKRNEYFQVVTYTGNLSVGKLAQEFNEYVDRNHGQYSAILFRNLPISSVESFQTLISNCKYEQLKYVAGTGTREKLTGEVYQSTNEPKLFNIDMHNEMSYLSSFPSKVFFCCVTAPSVDGETPIAFNKDIQSHLNPDFLKKAEEKGMRYYCNYSDKRDGYMPWKTQMQTETKKEAERILRELSINWDWNDDGSLTVWYNSNPVIYHPITNEKVWFNQIHASHNSYHKNHPNYKDKNLDTFAYPMHTTYGDGEEFEDEFIQHIREVTWNVATGFRWQQGDVLALDNLLAQHGRMSYEGDREIVVALTK